MNHVEFEANRRWHSETRWRLSDRKALEYTEGEDRLDNFKRLAKDLDSLPSLILGVYALKHRDGIRKWLSGRRTDLTETIQGRIYDLQNYLDLLLAMVDEGSV